jgi:hypothetical protein
MFCRRDEADLRHAKSLRPISPIMRYPRRAKSRIVSLANLICAVALLTAIGNALGGDSAQKVSPAPADGGTSNRSPFLFKQSDLPFLQHNQPLAYRFVATAGMLEEINFLGPKLQLPIQFPILEQDIRYALVSPTNLTTFKKPIHPLFMGRVDAKEWSFCFSEEGRLCFITNLRAFGERNRMGIAAWNDLLAGKRPIMTADDAYSLATNWLAQFPVNVVKLNKRHHPVVEQEFRWRDGETGGPKDYLPLFTVRWGKAKETESLNDCIIDIEIDGRMREMMDLRLEDDSVSQRPRRILVHQAELLRITDEEFASYNDDQRKQLVKRFLMEQE